MWKLAKVTGPVEFYPRNLFAKVWIKCLCFAAGFWIQALHGIDQKMSIICPMLMNRSNIEAYERYPQVFSVMWTFAHNLCWCLCGQGVRNSLQPRFHGG